MLFYLTWNRTLAKTNYNLLSNNSSLKETCNIVGTVEHSVPMSFHTSYFLIFLLFAIFVVHCVRVPLTGTTMVVFAMCGSVVGIVFCILYLLCVQYCGLLEGPSIVVYNVPTT